MIGDIRYYKGEQKCILLSDVSPMKTVLIQIMDVKGIVPVRMCWRYPRTKKIVPESEREYGQDPDSGSSCCYIGRGGEEE